MFRGAATIHKRTFERLVDANGVQFMLRMPVTPVAAVTSVDKVLGKRPAQTTTATDAYGDTSTVTGLWNTGYTIDTKDGAPSFLAVLGAADSLAVVIRCKLIDVLLDEDRPLGRTVFHTAKDVVYQGEVFTVAGVDSSGLPPLGPYICWVGLKKAGMSA